MGTICIISISVLDRMDGVVKCKFSKNKINFLGQVVDQFGIRPDPGKVAAIIDMSNPEMFVDFSK